MPLFFVVGCRLFQSQVSLGKPNHHPLESELDGPAKAKMDTVPSDEGPGAGRRSDTQSTCRSLLKRLA